MVDLGFLLLIFGFLAVGAVKTCFFPKDVNIYENRTANQLPELSVDGVLDGEFQDSVESAFADQILLAQTLESNYHFLNTSFQMKLIAPFIDIHCDEYISVLGFQTFGGSHLVYGVRNLDSQKDALDAKADNLNQIMAAHPELDYYVYYIEKETDINFATGEKVGLSEYLHQRLELPEEKFGVFSVDDFDTFDREFYQTDHHWNCYGSYEGYCQVIHLLDPSAEVLQPVGETVLPYAFSGSKASTIGAKDVFSEQFPAYRFDYPAMDITINGAPAEDYGHQDAYWNQTATGKISYADFYGGDAGEVVFDTHQPEKENLLIIGESFDNAILKLLASHFNCTYSIDLRNYERQCGEPFRFADYVQTHQITKVLFIGNVDYFVTSDFDVED